MNKIINLVNQEKVDKWIDEQRKNIIKNPPSFRYSQDAIELSERFKKEVQEYKDIKGRETPNIDIEKEITENYKNIISIKTSIPIKIWIFNYKAFTDTPEFEKYVKYNFNVKAIDNSIEIATANKEKINLEKNNKDSEHSVLKQKRGFFQRHFKFFRTDADKKISQEKSLLKKASAKEQGYINTLSKIKNAHMRKIAIFESKHSTELNRINQLNENLLEQRNLQSFCKKEPVMPTQKSNFNEIVNTLIRLEPQNLSASKQPEPQVLTPTLPSATI